MKSLEALVIGMAPDVAAMRQALAKFDAARRASEGPDLYKFVLIFIDLYMFGFIWIYKLHRFICLVASTRNRRGSMNPGRQWIPSSRREALQNMKTAQAVIRAPKNT